VRGDYRAGRNSGTRKITAQMVAEHKNARRPARGRGLQSDSRFRSNVPAGVCCAHPPSGDPSTAAEPRTLHPFAGAASRQLMFHAYQLVGGCDAAAPIANIYDLQEHHRLVTDFFAQFDRLPARTHDIPMLRDPSRILPLGHDQG
jgi:hypothetical protein